MQCSALQCTKTQNASNCGSTCIVVYRSEATSQIVSPTAHIKIALCDALLNSIQLHYSNCISKTRKTCCVCKQFSKYHTMIDSEHNIQSHPMRISHSRSDNFPQKSADFQDSQPGFTIMTNYARCLQICLWCARFILYMPECQQIHRVSLPLKLCGNVVVVRCKV